MPATTVTIKQKAAAAAREQSLLTALRHFVYSDLSLRFRNATEEQSNAIAANLKLTTDGKLDFGPFPRIFAREFISLAVTPDVSAFRAIERRRIEQDLFRTYGDRLLDVPGFYRNDAGEIRLCLPKRCGLLFYHNARGLLSGVACLPLNEAGFYWLLSSKRYGGPKATPMTPEVRDFINRRLGN